MVKTSSLSALALLTKWAGLSYLSQHTGTAEEAWIYRPNLKNHLRGTKVKPQRYARSAGKVWNGSGKAPQLS